MLSIKIEKEIRHDNKVAGGLTLRQLISVSAAAAACIVLALTTRLDPNTLLPAYLAIACTAGLFGWIKKDGMHAEDYLLRMMKRLVYQNGKLRYRTANRYIRLYNSAPGLRRERAAECPESSERKIQKKSGTNRGGKTKREKRKRAEKRAAVGERMRR